MKKKLLVARAILCAILLLLLTSCGSCRHVSSTLSHTRDSLRHASLRADSLARITGLHDSIYVHDSIHIIQRGDTVTRYVERTRIRNVWHADTVRILRQLSDTVYIERTDTVSVESHHATKNARKFRHGLVAGSFLTLLMYIILKRRG